MTGPNVLVLDIETSPFEVYVWRLFDEFVGLDQIKTEWSVLSYCAKWLGSKELIYNDTSGRGVNSIRNDLGLLKDLWKLLDTADIVVAQNGQKFDIKKINARMLMHGLGPYSPVRVVDTLTVARRIFGFSSNKLAWLSKHLTTTPKSEHKKFPGFELWTECLKDNPKAWAEMQKYNKQDVVACEQLYLKLRPWIKDHPNQAAYNSSGRQRCPKCASGKLQSRGFSVTQNGRYRRLHCQGCGGWSRGKDNLIDTAGRKELLV